MKRFGVLAFSALILLACRPTVVEIDLNKDPRVFSGKWEGMATENILFRAPILNLSKNQVAFSTNRKELLVLDMQNGQQIARVENYTAAPLAFSLDGNTLIELTAQGTDVSLNLRDTQNWQVIRNLQTPDTYPQISLDGNWALFPNSEGQKTTVVSLLSGQAVRSFTIQNYLPLLSSTGRYVVELPNYTQKPELRLWSVGDGSSKTLPIPQILIQTSPPPPPIQWESLRFNHDDTLLVGIAQNPKGQILVVWNLEQGKAIGQFALPTGFGALFTLAPDGLSGSLTWVSGEVNATKPKYLEIFWNTQGIVQTQDITQLLGESIPNMDIFTLEAGKAYLKLTRQYQPINECCQGSGLIAESVVRVGTLPWEFKREATSFPLRFDVKAQYKNETSYQISGTATLEGTSYSVSGEGAGWGIKYLPPSSQGLPPPTMQLYLELTDSANNKRFMSALQPIGYTRSESTQVFQGSLGPDQNTASYVGEYRVNLKRTTNP